MLPLNERHWNLWLLRRRSFKFFLRHLTATCNSVELLKRSVEQCIWQTQMLRPSGERSIITATTRSPVGTGKVNRYQVGRENKIATRVKILLKKNRDKNDNVDQRQISTNKVSLMLSSFFSSLQTVMTTSWNRCWWRLVLGQRAKWWQDIMVGDTVWPFIMNESTMERYGLSLCYMQFASFCGCHDNWLKFMSALGGQAVLSSQLMHTMVVNALNSLWHAMHSATLQSIVAFVDG